MFSNQLDEEAMTASNPYATFGQGTADGYSPQQAANQYGGIGRLVYFGLSFMIGLASQFAIIMLTEQAQGQPSPALVLGTVGIFSLVSLYIVSERLANMGASRWWSIIMLIPLVNLIISVQCLICPAGYTQHRKLDLPAKIVLGVFGLFILSIVAIIAIGVSAA